MLSESIYLKTLRGEKCSRTPIWFMRQAGRYLPEYRELRSKNSMLKMITTPELAIAVTLQPITRFQFDAAIIFADILNPLIGMGVDLDFVEGEGPKIFNPIKSANDVDRLVVPDVRKSVGYTLNAINECSSILSKQGVPLVGFSGAPFTLSSYLIEGGKLHSLNETKQFMLQQSEAWHVMQEKLSSMIIEYLAAQAASGASALQIFDSWAGVLTPSQFKEYALPYLQKIIAGVRAKTSVPLLYFSTGTAGLLNIIAQLGVDGFSVDWRQQISFVRREIGAGRAIQGNLDPLLLFGPLDKLERGVREVLADGLDSAPFIFNLGHGILPKTPIAHVERVVQIVRGR